MPVRTVVFQVRESGDATDRNFTAVDTVRDIIIGTSDGLMCLLYWQQVLSDAVASSNNPGRADAIALGPPPGSLLKSSKWKGALLI